MIELTNVFLGNMKVLLRPIYVFDVCPFPEKFILWMIVEIVEKRKWSKNCHKTLNMHKLTKHEKYCFWSRISKKVLWPSMNLVVEKCVQNMFPFSDNYYHSIDR